ncbi:MAG: hypothetical protein L3J39_19140 [Verrucomicrobiales bacterium]|nr:hypothetical protein [Verrucomicrobiales bacterium]
MKASTELLLYQLLWTCDQLTRPTFNNLSASFESWAYSSGLLRTINRLENEQWLETQGKSLDRVIRLTEKSRQFLIGDRDPESEWSRKWDGNWRMVLFDIPESKRNLRRKIREILHSQHFGCLQQSVWISPHPMNTIKHALGKTRADPSSLTLLEAQSLPGDLPSDMVNSAWDFSKINANYAAYIKHLKRLRNKRFLNDPDYLIAEEKRLWEIALNKDPLLPNALIPNDYLGKKAHQLRQQQLPIIIKSLLNHHCQQDNSPSART